ncbi:TPA: hypothetical protein EYP38_05090 [Candidatus Micrarchaeota archaeon]|nr:hypothetical protein [Candidatus Micrarchaeota archaeon]
MSRDKQIFRLMDRLEAPTNRIKKAHRKLDGSGAAKQYLRNSIPLSGKLVSSIKRALPEEEVIDDTLLPKRVELALRQLRNPQDTLQQEEETVDYSEIERQNSQNADFLKLMTGIVDVAAVATVASLGISIASAMGDQLRRSGP